MKPLVKKSTPCYGNKNRNRNMNIRSKVVDEAFQLVHHVSFILCYIVLYNFLSLIFSLIRDRKLVWEDIT